jgi:hypothetical protein
VDAFLEQRLRTCEACHRPFAIQYEFTLLPADSGEADRVWSRWVSCPSGCGRRNAVVLPFSAREVVAKLIPGVERPTGPTGPSTLQRIWAIQGAPPPKPQGGVCRRNFLAWLPPSR